MISNHKKKANNGLDRVSEKILTYQCRRNHKFNLWLLQNQTMTYQVRIVSIVDSSSPSAGPPTSAAPEEPKDLDHVSECIHVHPYTLVNNNNNSVLYLLHKEYSRIRQPRVKMKIQQPWIHRIVWVIIRGHYKSKKTHGDRVPKKTEKKKGKQLQKSSQIHRRKPRRISLWIQMKTMKNLKMSLKPLQTLRLPYQYYLFNQDQQQARKDQQPIRETCKC